MPKKQSKYDHHPFIMPKNEVHGRVGQLQTRAPGVEKHMADHKQKEEIFQAQYPECYKGGVEIEVHPTIARMMQFYNKKFSKLCVSNVLNMEGVKSTDYRV